MSTSILAQSIAVSTPRNGGQCSAFRLVFELSDMLVDRGHGGIDALRQACELLHVDLASARAALNCVDFAAAFRR